MDFVIAAKAGQALYARMQPFECSVRDAWVSPVRREIPNPVQLTGVVAPTATGQRTEI